MKNLLIIAILMLSQIGLAQNNNLKTSTFSSDTILPLVEIREKRNIISRKALPETLPIGIFAAKKTDVLQLQQLNANLVQNQSRQVFGKMAGVSVWENDGSGVQIGVAARGLSPNRSWEFNVRQNGYDISSDPMGYPEAYFNPPLDAVAQVEVVRGAASLQFGPQFGGLLNYIIKKGDSTRPISVETQQSGGSFGLLSSYNSVGGTVGNLRYFSYVNYRQADGWRDHSAYKIFNGYANLTYQIAKKWAIGLEYTRLENENQQSGGLTDAQFLDNPRQSLRARNWFGTPWNLANFHLEGQLKNTRLDLKIFGLVGERNSVGFVRAMPIRDTLTAAGVYNLRQIDRDWYKNWGAELRSQTDFRVFGKENTLALGARYFDGSTRRAQQGTGSRNADFDLNLLESAPNFPRDLNFDNKNTAVFFENLIRFNQNWVLTFGARLEALHTGGGGRFSLNANGTQNLVNVETQKRNFILGGVGVEYHPFGNHKTEIYANAAQAYRPVTFADLTPSATTDQIDPNLRDANGWNADLGYRGKLRDWLNFDVNAFFIQYDDRIGSLTRTSGASFYQFRTNLGRSEHRGIEAFLEGDVFHFMQNKNMGTLNAWASLSWIDAKYRNFETQSVQNGQIVTNNLAGKQVEYAPTSIHRWGLTYQKGGFSATFQANWVSSVFTDANNTVLPTANGQSGKLSAYRVLDFSTTYRFFEKYYIKLSASNLENAAYSTRRSGGYPGPGLISSDGRSFVVSLGGNF